MCLFSWGGDVAGAQGLNNLAETSSIMKGPPEGCVSPPAVPVLRRCPGLPQKNPDTDAVELAKGISVSRGGVGGDEGRREAQAAPSREFALCD